MRNETTNQNFIYFLLSSTPNPEVAGAVEGDMPLTFIADGNSDGGKIDLF